MPASPSAMACAIALHHLLDHPRGGNAGEVGSSRRGREAQASLIRSCAGLPMTLWSRSRIWTSTRPSASATGPRLPRWQSPQIQIAGPLGSRLAERDSATPFVEFDGVAPHIGMGRSCHFERAAMFERIQSSAGDPIHRSSFNADGYIHTEVSNASATIMARASVPYWRYRCVPSDRHPGGHGVRLACSIPSLSTGAWSRPRST